MTEQARKPAAFRLESPTPEAAPKPARAPRAVKAPRIVFDPEPAEAESPTLALPLARPLRPWRFASILAASLAALVSLWAGLAIARLIEDLFARSAPLGWIALGFAALAGLAALAIIFRESWGLIRLGRIEGLQADAARALALDDKDAARRALAALRSIYAARPDAAWGLKALAEHESAIMDPADRIRLAGRDLIQPFDEQAHRIIARAARRVMLLTTLTPAAALDILFVAAQNLRMLRELATLYGGRPSTLATLRLARMVVGHLAVTGGLALSDSLMQHMVGKGLVGRLSARFGEGAVNGILTARIGLAARDVCRPIPPEAGARETLAGLVRELLNFGGDDDARATP